MQIIINFLDLKRGEIWLEMLQRVKDDKFDLVPSDAEVINCLSTISKNKTSAVLDTQRYLIQRSKENDEIQELEFYKVIQKCHLQDHLKALREADLMARTTSYEYLVERRLWQKTELQKALTKAPTFARMHRTTDGPLNITVWPTRTKVVDSEINQLEGGDSGDKDTPTKQDQAVVVVASSTRTSFDISESVASSVMSMGTFNVGDPADHFPLLPSAATLTDMDATPPSVEGGFYIVSAEALRKALQVLLAKDKKKNWLKRVNDENYWRVRAKWKQDWYPEENLTRTAYKI
ncbi:uncharacterized protein LOC118436323 [Folsomia candida]|nr:uncharacterized protein LOC118436323 [Folsomia candida]